MPVLFPGIGQRLRGEPGTGTDRADSCGDSADCGPTLDHSSRQRRSVGAESLDCNRPVREIANAVLRTHRCTQTFGPINQR